MSRRKLTAWACALLAAGAMTVSGAGAASAEPVGAQGLPTFLGVKLVDESGNGQCEGPENGAWTTNPEWTNPIRLDTDNRPGGCELSFGIGDIDGSLAGLDVTYQLVPHDGGAHAGQCGYNQTLNHIPIGPSFSRGTPVRVDSDGRAGWCDLIFTQSGRNDVVLDVQFYADGDSGQCKGATLPGEWHSVPPGQRLALGIDTDGRAGGCKLALRLRKF